MPQIRQADGMSSGRGVRQVGQRNIGLKADVGSVGEAVVEVVVEVFDGGEPSQRAGIVRRRVGAARCVDEDRNDGVGDDVKARRRDMGSDETKHGFIVLDNLDMFA